MNKLTGFVIPRSNFLLMPQIQQQMQVYNSFFSKAPNQNLAFYGCTSQVCHCHFSLIIVVVVEVLHYQYSQKAQQGNMCKSNVTSNYFKTPTYNLNRGRNLALTASAAIATCTGKTIYSTLGRTDKYCTSIAAASTTQAIGHPPLD